MGFITNALQGAAQLTGLAPQPRRLNPYAPGTANYDAWLAQANGGELPPTNAAPAPAPAPVREKAPPTVAAPEDEIVAMGARKFANADVQAPGWSDLPGTTPPIEVNSPNLTDQRALIYNSKERQKEEAAKILGIEYKPEYQNEVGKDFKANPNLQFGTRGVARDIIGNAVDFLGGLVGRRPTYHDEKIRDKMYGWDQGPEARAAAINRVMEYDPQAGMEIMKNLTAVDAQRTNSDATSEFKKQQVVDRQLKGITGLSTAIMRAPDVNKAYQAYRPALQKQLDTALGADAPELPPEYDPNIIGGLPMLDFKGADVQREVKSIRDNDLQRWVVSSKIASAKEIAAASNATKERIARIQADSRLSVAEKYVEARKAIADDKLVETGRTEDIGTGTTSREYSPAGTVRRNARQIIYDKQGRAFYQYADGRMEPKQ